MKPGMIWRNDNKDVTQPIHDDYNELNMVKHMTKEHNVENV